MPVTQLCDSSADQLEADARAWAAEHDKPEWAFWLAAVLPAFCSAPFATHHVEFWNWLWRIERHVRPDAFIGVWPRGGAKSTSAEAAVVALAARRRRRYGLYVCDTQDRADDHVSNVGSMLESERVEMFYEALAQRRVGKHGNSRGWRRNRLWTADGFVIDAIGLDVAARGVKLEDQRPDFIVVDDVDGHLDSPRVTNKKLETLTHAVLPAGSDDVAVLAIQNLVNPNGVFARLLDGRADFLKRRQVSGPIPALRNFSVDVDGGLHGEPTWAGQSLALCQAQAEDWGVRAFRREAQHDVTRREGALWSPEQIDVTRRQTGDSPLAACMVGVDPSGGSGPDNDAQGIVVVGRREDGHGFVLADRTVKTAPEKWGKRAILTAVEFAGDLVVEANYGGDMAISVIRTAASELGYGIVVKDARGKFLSATTGVEGSLVVWRISASVNKTLRAEPIAALYGDPDDSDTWPTARMHHAVPLPDLEDEMTSFVAGDSASPNRLDAMVWAASKLFAGAGSGRGGLVVRHDPPDGLLTAAAKAEFREPGPVRRNGMRVRV